MSDVTIHLVGGGTLIFQGQREGPCPHYSMTQSAPIHDFDDGIRCDKCGQKFTLELARLIQEMHEASWNANKL